MALFSFSHLLDILLKVKLGGGPKSDKIFSANFAIIWIYHIGIVLFWCRFCKSQFWKVITYNNQLSEKVTL